MSSYSKLFWRTIVYISVLCFISNNALWFMVERPSIPPDVMKTYPDSKVHVANMGPTWVLSAPDGPYVGPWTLLSGFTINKMRW